MKPAQKHKIAITVCITLSVGLVVYAYYHLAAFLEDKSLDGINLYLDNFLRWSAMGALGIAVSTYIFAWINNAISRSALIILSSLLIADIVFAIIAFFAFRTFVVKGFQKMFIDASYIARASDFETGNMCCGWNDFSSAITPDCQYSQSCIQVVRQLLGGKNTLIISLSLTIALALQIYVLVAHILIISTTPSGFANIPSSSSFDKLTEKH